MLNNQMVYNVPSTSIQTHVLRFCLSYHVSCCWIGTWTIPQVCWWHVSFKICYTLMIQASSFWNASILLDPELDGVRYQKGVHWWTVFSDIYLREPCHPVTNLSMNPTNCCWKHVWFMDSTVSTAHQNYPHNVGLSENKVPQSHGLSAFIWPKISGNYSITLKNSDLRVSILSPIWFALFHTQPHYLKSLTVQDSPIFPAPRGSMAKDSSGAKVAALGHWGLGMIDISCVFKDFPVCKWWFKVSRLPPFLGQQLTPCYQHYANI